MKQRMLDRFGTQVTYPLLLLMSGIGFVVVGMQFMILQGFGGDLPLRDEWQLAVQQIILPDIQGSLDWRSFFIPLGGHPLFYSKWLVWLEWKATGQIDFLLGTMINSYAVAFLAILTFILLRKIRSGLDFWWALFCVGLFGLPHSFEGLFMCICNGYLFYCIFALLLFICLPLWRPSPIRLIASLFFTAAGTLSYETGYAAPLAVVAVLIFCLINSPEAARRRWLLLSVVALSLSILIMFVCFGPHAVAVNSSSNFMSFCRTLNNALSWPLRYLPGGALLTWTPVIIYLIRWRQFLAQRREQEFGLLEILMLWSAVLCLSIAIARHNSLGAIYSRYEQFLVFNLITNFAVAAFIWGRTSDRIRLILSVWAILLGTAFFIRSTIVATEYIPRFYVGEHWQVEQLGRYIYQPEAGRIPQEEPVSANGFQTSIRASLDSPVLRPFLPPSIEPSLPYTLEEGTASKESSVLNLPAPSPRYFPWILQVPAHESSNLGQRIWLNQNFPQAKEVLFWVLSCPKTAFFLREKNSNRTVPIELSAPNDNCWRPVSVLLPPGLYELTPRSLGTEYWLAGGFPVSNWYLPTRWILHQAGYILGFGCFLLLVGGLWLSTNASSGLRQLSKDAHYNPLNR